MASIFVAPGIEARIQDFSAYAPHLASTILGMVGTASKGPMNTRTLITTEGQLIETFGAPSATHLGLLAAIRYLRYGRQLWFVRVGTYEATASGNIQNAGETATSLQVSAATPGTYGNNLRVVVSAGTEAGYRIVVTYNGVTSEIFDNVLLGTANEDSDEYVETRINGVSSLITVVDVATQATLATGTTALTGGLDGTPVENADVIGAYVDTTRTGLQLFANPNDIDVNLLSAPGLCTASVVAAMATICQTRNDSMYLAEVPSGLSVTEAVDWTNGAGTGDDAPAAALNDWRGAIYYPWVQVLDGYSASNIWCPPSGHVAGVMAYTDHETDPWFAPAGPRRGMLRDALDVEHNVTDGEHEYMCPVSGGSGQNNCNPIRNVPGEGIMVYSQKTLYRASTSLRDINVVRMLFYAMKTIATAVRYLQFEPNDAVTWRAFENLCNPVLRAIKGRRGIYDFRVVCEEYMEDNPDLVNNDTMLGQIFLQPTRTAEIIVIDFTLMPYGAEFDLGTE